jgi:hypothetical protein
MLGWVAVFILLGYLVPHVLVSLLPSQDLKKKARRCSRAARVAAADALCAACTLAACSMAPRGHW